MKNKNCKDKIVTLVKSTSKIELNSEDIENSFYENIVNTVREPLLILDKNLRVVKASKSFLDFFKVSSDETIGKLIYDLGDHQWDIPKLRELLETILPEKTFFDNFEVEHDFLSIGKRIMLLNARKIETAFGNEKIILLAIEDITSRKKAEESLVEKNRLNSEYLEVLLEHANAPIIVWDSGLRIERFNQEFEKLSGYNSSEVIDKPIEILFPKDKTDSIIGLLKNNLNDNSSEAIEIDILTKDKIIKTVLWNSISIFDEDDKNIVATITQDITNRKQVENKLELLETRYRRLFESAKDGILILDAETGKIIDVNPFLCELLDYSKEKFVDKELWQIGFFKDIAANKEKFLELQKKEYIRYEDLPLKTANGRMINVEFVSNVYLVNNNKVIQCNIRDITERKHAEYDLKISETRLRTLVKTIPDLIWLKDANGVYLLCNPMFERFFGADASDIIGKTDYDFVDKKLADFFRKNDIKAMDAGKPTSNEELITFADDGHSAYLETIKVPTYDADGKLVGVLGIGRNITERKQAEETLRESEEKYKTITQSTVDVIFTLDKSGKMLFFNESVERVLGYKIEEVIGKSFTKFVQKKDLIKLFNQIKSAFQHNNISNFITQIYHKDGHLVDVEINGKLIKQNGKFVLQGSMRDITERKQAEELLQETEERYRAFFENSMDGILLTRPDGRTISANQAACKMFGYTENELINIGRSGVVDNTDPKLSFLLAERAEKGKVQCELTFIRKDGTHFPCEISSAIFKNGKGSEYTSMIIRDISERKQIQQKIKESEKRFRAIFYQAPFAIALIDTQGIILISNLNLSKMTGYSLDELSRMKFADFTHPDDIDKDMKRFTDLTDGKIYSYTMEKRFIHKSGAIIWVSINASLLSDVNGNLIEILGMAEDITERKNSENKLKESEEKFRIITENSADAIFIVNDHGKYLYVNAKVVQMLGYSKEEMMRFTIADISPKDRIEEYNQIFKKLLNVGFAFSEIDLVAKEGNLISTDFNAVLLPNGLIYASCRDISERIEIQNKIKFQAELLFNVGQAVIATDLLGRVIYWNNTAENIYGWTIDEAIGKNIIDLTPAEQTQDQASEIMEQLIAGNSWSGEFLVKRKDGSIFPSYVTDTPINDSNGKLIGVIGISSDITEKKQAEDKIMLLAHALKSINECVSITDIEDKITFVNESFLKNYGYEENELLGKNINMVRSENNSHDLTKEIIHSTIQGRWHGELWNKRKDGSEFQIYLSTTIIYDKENKILGLIGVAKDVTELKLNQQELIKAKEKAEESDKMKSEFLAQMSHEIRTPLNAVLGYTEYLSDLFGEPKDSEVIDCFSGVNLAANRIIRTIDLLLNTAELQAGSYQPRFHQIDLDKDILNKLYKEQLQNAKQRGLEFIYNCELNDSKILADDYSTTHIFANLIDNALNYTKKGKVEILLTKNEDDNVVVEIKDTGIGIAKDFLPKLFNPFAQEEQGYSRSFEGNGLGLALVKNYCDVNNARIEVESVKNVGSTFRIIFDNKFTVKAN